MRFIVILLLTISACTDAISVNVRNGIERYGQYAGLLQGKQVGIVTNHTSRIGERHSVDVLQEKGVRLIRIFCPEHGFRGDAEAGEKIGNYRDEPSGLEVVSLYGNKKKPTAEDLRGIDVLVFDLQDVGVRFYTYLSTLHYVMEACAEQGIPLIVMDRFNPNAFYVDGPVLRKEQRSFIGMHPVPIVYGMTIGEYARMINGEGWLKGGIRCDLTVIPCENWRRDKIVTLTCKPSPNLPDSVSVMLYPSTCLFEGTVVNEGRGTHRPFQVFGHPDLHDMPYSYVPRSIQGMSTSPKCAGQICHGMDLGDQYDVIRNGKRLNLTWLLLAYKNYKGQAPFFMPMFDKLAGNRHLREDILAGKTEEEIRARWQKELEEFLKIRGKYLLYQ